MSEYLKKNKLLFVFMIFFIVISLVHIIYATYAQRGLINDGLIWFLDVLNSAEQKHWSHIVFSNNHRYRASVIFTNELPIHLVVSWFDVHSKALLGYLYSFPLFLFPFLVTVYNCYLAKRTKRYDFVVYSLLLYGIFILPCMLYSIVEMYLATTVYLLLFHYICAKIDYKFYDIIIILITSAIAFSSTEAVVYLAPILIWAAIKYSQGETNKNKAVKYSIAGVFLISCILGFYYTFLIPHNDEYFNMPRFWRELKYLLNCWRAYFTKIDIAVIILFVLTFFNRKKFSGWFWSFLIIASLIYFISVFNSGIYYVSYYFSRRFYLYAVILILALLSLTPKISQFFEEHKEALYNNLIFLLIFSAFNTGIQIASSYSFIKSVGVLKTILHNSNKKFINPKDDMKAFYDIQFNDTVFYCGTYLYDSIAFNTYKPKSIIFLTDSNKSFYCPKPFFKENEICTIYSCLSLKNKYWDLTDFKPMPDTME